MAATVEFDFRNLGGSFSSDPINLSSGGVDLEITAESLFESDPGIGQFADGLGLGNGNPAVGPVSPGQARVGLGELLRLSFADPVILTALDLTERSRGIDQEFQLRVDGVAVGSFTVDGTSGTATLPFAQPGSVFEIVGATADTVDGDGKIRDGLLLSAATVEPAAVIPLGPTAPLLGGALVLLAWRARRKKAA